jgi:hypothetical protein
MQFQKELRGEKSNLALEVTDDESGDETMDLIEQALKLPCPEEVSQVEVSQPDLDVTLGDVFAECGN